MATTQLFRREPIEPHDPALYATSRVADGICGFDAVDAAAVERFHQDGFLVIHDAFSPTEVAEVLDALLDLIDGANPEFKGPELEALATNDFLSLPREAKQDHVRKLIYFVEYEPRLLAFSRHPRLLALLERLMGQPPVLWADQALLKPPRIGREKPWHQDVAYFDVDPTALVVGCWIALDEATLDNGCMVVIPGSHQGGPVVHFQRRDWQICDSLVAVEQAVAAPLRPGGLLLFNGLLHHGTPSNHSPLRRRAMQLHYRPIGSKLISREERMAVFGSEGRDVDC